MPLPLSLVGSPSEVASSVYAGADRCRRSFPMSNLADDGLEIAVSDHGEGVPAEEQERIFQSFHRVSDDEGSVKGSGLGLYFADRLVRAMGGSVWVESPIWPSEDAPGARFSIRVPLAEDVPDDALAVEGPDKTGAD